MDIDTSEEDARRQLIDGARDVARRGLSHGTTGNVSVRSGDRFLVTPTGSSLATVQLDELAMVDLDGRAVGRVRPSKEAGLHAAVYRARPDCTAVVHTHSVHAVALSCLSEVDATDALPALTAYYAMRVESLPLVAYCAPGDERLAVLTGHAARTSRSVLLRNHGVVVADSEMISAVDVAEEIERTAQLHLLCGVRPTAPLTPHERRRLYLLSRAVRPPTKEVNL